MPVITNFLFDGNLEALLLKKVTFMVSFNCNCSLLTIVLDNKTSLVRF